jgi:ubiquinone/menaquinone biosynthesis C-methylase UbiE
MQSLSSDLSKIKEFIQMDGKAMLEVGCGDGRLSSQLAHEVLALTAIDPDTALIDRARKNIDGVDFQVGSGEQLKFDDQSFDVVLFGYSLHHQDTARALAQARRVLRDDGRILIIEPAPEGQYTQFVTIFQEDEIDRLQTTLAHIKSGGFRILQQDVYALIDIFEDDQALYHYFMDRFMENEDPRALEKMKAILGRQADERPIVVEDKINIFLVA